MEPLPLIAHCSFDAHWSTQTTAGRIPGQCTRSFDSISSIQIQFKSQEEQKIANAIEEQRRIDEKYEKAFEQELYSMIWYR